MEQYNQNGYHLFTMLQNHVLLDTAACASVVKLLVEVQTLSRIRFKNVRPA